MQVFLCTLQFSIFSVREMIDSQGSYLFEEYKISYDDATAALNAWRMLELKLSEIPSDSPDYRVYAHDVKEAYGRYLFAKQKEIEASTAYLDYNRNKYS